jgi:hypothetical protein
MELAKEGGILVLTGRRAQVRSKNIPFLLKAFLHIYDDKWLPDLAKFYQIRGGYNSSLGAPNFQLSGF